MTPEEKQQFQLMQQDIVQVKRDVAEIGQKVDKLLMYVVGDENSRETSMLSRIRELEKDKLEDRKLIQELKDNQTISTTKVKIMWAMVGAVGVAILGYIMFLIRGNGK